MSLNDGVNPQRVRELEGRIDMLRMAVDYRDERIAELENVIAELDAVAEGWMAQKKRIAELESLVRFMEPFFLSAVSHECGCPDGYFEPRGCDDGCKALKELSDRMAELGLDG